MRLLRGVVVLFASLCVSLFLLLLFAPGAVAHADGGAPQLAYIANSRTGLSVIDIQQQKVTTTFSLSGDPSALYLSLDGRFLYVAQPELGRVTMLGAKTGQAFCHVTVPGHPSLLAFDQSSSLLYTAGNQAASVTVFAPNDCTIKQTLQTDGPVSGLAIPAANSGVTGDQLWVSTPSGLEVFVHGRPEASIPLPGDPQYMSIPPGTSAYVTTREGKVYAIDLSTHQVSPPLLTGGQFGPMDYDAITDEIFVPDRRNRRLDVLAPVSLPVPSLPREPENTFSFSAAPQAVAITSDGQLGFVALTNGQVAMLDIQGRSLLATVAVGGSPQFVITGLYPPLLGTTPQGASVWNIVLPIVAWAIVIALLAIPIVFLMRSLRKQTGVSKAQSQGSE